MYMCLCLVVLVSVCTCVCEKERFGETLAPKGVGLTSNIHLCFSMEGV